MLINFSSDQLFLQEGGDRLLLPFDNIERKLPEMLQTFWNKYKFQQMVIINGPGSFTQLRVGCISCNILNITNNLEIDFIDIPKLDLFAKAIQQKDIPSLGVIFMGQRKKMRLVDFESSHQKPKIDLVTSEDVLSMIKSRDYFIDRMTGNHPVLEPLDQKNMISELRFIQEKVTFLYAGKTLEIDVTKRGTSKKQLEPRYFMDPQIG